MKMARPAPREPQTTIYQSSLENTAEGPVVVSQDAS